MPVLETERLRLQRFTLEDAPFILRLVNEPSWLRYIGDRGIRDLDGARKYLSDGPIGSYERNGFGMYRIDSKRSGAALGLCGLLRREGLEGPDLGFALLSEHCGAGIATEAALAVLGEARGMGLPRVLAITMPANAASIRVLEKVGFSFEQTLRLPPDTGQMVRLYSRALG